MSGIQKAVLLLAGVVGCQLPVNGGPAPAAPPATVTVRQVLTTQALAGETVVVTGRCLGKGAAKVARGARPLASDLWQIEDHGVAAWVAGPKPHGCDADAVAAGTITALVAQDTLPPSGFPRTVRQYLVVR